MESSPAEPVATARRFYAEELRFKTRMTSAAVFAAFASVPRERFVGPGPWRIQSWGEFWFTGDHDPRNVYHDTLISLDEAKRINNGQPSLWAYYLDRISLKAGGRILHLGCGTGYYTAIMAEVVGREGKVVAIEIDEALAQRARIALEPWPQVTVYCADGTAGPFDPADAVVVSAGATHPLPAWLAAVQPGGRLLFPLTANEGLGIMAILTRSGQDRFAAWLNGGVGFIEFEGARDPEVGRRLAEALHHGHSGDVKSLRCDAHERDESCWLHGDGWCFSNCEPSGQGPFSPTADFGSVHCD
ncbi:MAG TPA: methyltransferase domain-containing protein [Terracidiphilus sp.]|nr:methyltransferase domain-containing protein [Terracidiphilus sp.]